MQSIQDKFEAVNACLGHDNNQAELLLKELASEQEVVEDQWLHAKHLVLTGWLRQYSGQFKLLASMMAEYEALLELARSQRCAASNDIINFLGLVVQADSGLHSYRQFMFDNIEYLDKQSPTAVPIIANLGQLLEEEGDIFAARDYYEQAVGLSDQFEPSVARANALLGYAQVLSELRESRAIGFAEIALRELRDLNQARRVAIAESSLSIMCFASHDYKRGLQFLCSSLEYFYTHNDVLTTSHLIMNCAQLLYVLGDVFNGKRVLEMAKLLAHNTEDSRLQGRSILVEGECAYEVGLVDLALTRFREFFRTITTGEYRNVGLAVYTGSRVVQTMLERNKREDLIECVSVLESIDTGSRGVIARAHIDFAVAHRCFVQQEYAKCHALVQGAVEFLGYGRCPQMSVDAWLLRTEAFLRENNVAEAYEAAMEAFSLSKKYPEYQVAVTAAQTLANIVHIQGDIEKSAEFSREAFRVADFQRSRVAHNIEDCFDEIDTLLKQVSQAYDQVCEN